MAIQYKLEQLNHVQLIGVLRKYESDDEMQKDIPSFWQKVNNDGVVDDLIELSNQTLSGMLGVILQKEDNHFDYFIGVPCDNSNNNDSHFNTLELSAHKYVVIDAKGKVPEAIKSIMPKIYQELLPQAKFKTIRAPMFEHYLPGNTQSNDYITEIWIPIEVQTKD
ncbi:MULTISPECIES: GyrI-like domain-containing protein [Staphylococcus]|uniref:AraC family transcriptional regulator n=1 Tax=Staphylococcus haemolyticus TaxID=1283 RepID=A0A2K0A5V1_STAHA|nr:MULTISPECIES: GyrI-like domain-containing protein [Staphylococcus]KGF27877.1 hypothetical protein HMPREF2135_03635 [Staphylococcus haemolyticus DNF00585]MCH4382334.1 GyrI-like domain-containing protein [Staphylococcus haemolyticus]MCH4389159.1 GyrI-like domain-containing protein [Staphylococcus haemolyticus]MCH4403422.1 GyrI-like domain-containing protein [Staphylococcus haemolyticus]MCH4443109.1 GyrI-like domain-containing protein [Staphylococcus haemolyticus]